ncbi:unnamed protein product [Schistosoma mattheei]|uniref:Uncharacterized protein n=1 Tax=Schistosoma mattheei TaxID=31246 RepID=A0A183NJW8_9TREM|nr:unnamed protein product [Schistosoma mattheei]
MTAENAVTKVVKQLYDTTKKLARIYGKSERLVKGKAGKLITEIEEQRNKWVEHFWELLNKLDPLNQPNTEVPHTNLPADVTTPTIEEIRMAVRRIKNGKVVEPQNIPAKSLKSYIVVTVDMLYNLFRNIWEEEQVLMNWNEGQLIKVSKKGDLSNYGGTLLSVTGNIVHRILLNGMKISLNIEFRDQQTGFSMDRLCTDRITDHR